MNNSDYWAHRMKTMEDAIKDQTSDKYIKNAEKQFDNLIKATDEKIRAWYQRFSDNNGKISYEQAQKLLTSGELEEFKWDVTEYRNKCIENGVNHAWIKQLENASSRYHISRYESLKIQLQQEAEMATQATIKATSDASAAAYTKSYYHTAFEIQRGLGVGWTMQKINTDMLKKLLSRPWTADNKTFTARCWTDKNKLVEVVNQELTRMLALGEAPDRAISAISKKLKVSKSNAGRIVMTESSYFSSVAQKDCFNNLDVERYQIVGTLSARTCELCGSMDGKVFKMSDYKAGVTANPFHPWCRCCTTPYFEDMENIGERYARDVKTGKAYMLPQNTTYEQWKEMQDGLTDNKKRDIMDIVRDTIGTVKNTPIDMINAIQGANPNFSAGGAYRINCQRCVQAFELRRRGYNVIAKPKPSIGNLISWGSECFIQPGQYSASWQAFSLGQTEAAVKRELIAAPEGARYAIYVKWKGRGSGAHVFIAEKENGVIHYMDPQSGNLDASGYFSRGSKGNFGFFRLDDKSLTTDKNIIAQTVEVKAP